MMEERSPSSAESTEAEKKKSVRFDDITEVVYIEPRKQNKDLDLSPITCRCTIT
jgi:hypothetical protein